MSKVRVVVFGIYRIGVESLKSMIAQGIEPVAVVTKPGTELDPQPVAVLARERGLLLLEPDSPREEPFVRRLRELEPDLIAVAGYHRIIPKSVLDIPPMGTINLHGSLLPRYRGPCTWKWAIANGEAATGVTVHVMTPQLDNGDILAQRVVPIAADDTGATLFDKISCSGGELLAETIRSLESGVAVRVPQDESAATYYGYPSEAETRIAWDEGAERIGNLVRGMSPNPGAWTVIAGRTVRIGRATVSASRSAEPPGTIVASTPDSISVATATFDLVVHEMRIDGEPLPPARLLEEIGRSGAPARFGC